MRSIIIVFIIVSGLVFTNSCWAERIAYEFTGSVTEKTGILMNVPGFIVNGYFIYDTDWTRVNGSMHAAHYEANNENFGIFIQFDSVDYKSTELPSANHHIDIGDKPLFDEFNYMTNAATGTVFLIELLSDEDNLDALTSTDLPVDLDLEKFTADRYGRMTLRTASGEQQGVLQFDLIKMLIAPDSDNDDILDLRDNCMLVSNADQLDTDGDGIGNICDADFDQNCVIDFTDLNIMSAFFFLAGDFDTDLNGDGQTDFTDLNIMAQLFFLPPGPSGVPNACDL